MSIQYFQAPGIIPSAAVSGSVPILGGAPSPLVASPQLAGRGILQATPGRPVLASPGLGLQPQAMGLQPGAPLGPGGVGRGVRMGMRLALGPGQIPGQLHSMGHHVPGQLALVGQQLAGQGTLILNGITRVLNE